MRLPLLALILFCCLGATLAVAAPTATLKRLSKQEDPLTTRVQLDFSTLPSYRVTTSGQRIDLFLAGASSDAPLSALPEGGSVIKILLGSRSKELMVSFLLANPPKEVKLERDPNLQQLTLVISWGRTPPATRPALARSLPAAKAKSGYTGRWLEFFREYQLPLVVPTSRQPSLVGLPLLKYHAQGEGGGAEGLRAGVGEFSQGDWPAALEMLSRTDRASLKGPDLEAHLLLLAEALCQVGQYQAARPLLADYLARHPESKLVPRGRFLLCICLAGGGDYYAAAAELKQGGEPGGGWPTPFLGAVALLQAELDLFNGRPERALRELDRLPTQPPLLEARRQLRRADALAELGRSAEALAGYQGFADQPQLWKEQSFSLARFAETLQRTGDWKQSAQRYQQLAIQLAGEPGQALASYGAARGFLRVEDLTHGLPLLAGGLVESETSEAGWRSRLLELDRAVLAGNLPKGMEIAEGYEALVPLAPNRALAEEAAFKRLLALAQNGLPQLCLRELPGFVRRYGSGSLRAEAEALLVELLPGVLEDLLARGEDLPALVLVEQHREFLAEGGIKAPFLLRLGESFERVGLLEKAEKVYSYLFEGHAGRKAQAEFYLPLARVYRDRRQPERALELIDRYLAAYRKGKERTTLLEMKGEILYGQGQPEQAVKVLTSVKGGLSPAAAALLARIYWELGELDAAAQAFAKAGQGTDGSVGIQALALQAESLYRQNKGEQALPLYQQLGEEGAFADQALYRSAQIHLAAGRGPQALKYLQQLVDEGRSPRWKLLAQELLELQTLTGR